MSDQRELPNHNPDRLMSMAELAQIYGKDKRTMQRWCLSGRWPDWQHVGNQYVVPWHNVLADLKEE